MRIQKDFFNAGICIFDIYPSKFLSDYANTPFIIYYKMKNPSIDRMQPIDGKICIKILLAEEELLCKQEYFSV